jgi:hypothetical protein
VYVLRFVPLFSVSMHVRGIYNRETITQRPHSGIELLINKQANPLRPDPGRRTRSRRLYWPIKPCQVLLVVKADLLVCLSATLFRNICFPFINLRSPPISTCDMILQWTGLAFIFIEVLLICPTLYRIVTLKQPPPLQFRK